MQMNHEKILMIIDDDRDDRFFFALAIKEINNLNKCFEAEQGVDALEQLKNAKQLPDFIFLDINMPKMDGWECLKELKKNESLKYIPVIMYSTSSREEDINKAYKLGAVHFLTKPFNITTLADEIITSMKVAEQGIQHH
jgi:CheY-like chemotaxis protein